jgi:hypothetical protein
VSPSYADGGEDGADLGPAAAGAARSDNVLDAVRAGIAEIRRLSECVLVRDRLERIVAACRLVVAAVSAHAGAPSGVAERADERSLAEPSLAEPSAGADAEGLGGRVGDGRRAGAPSSARPGGSPAAVATDDLLPTLVFILSRAQPPHLLVQCRLVELFCPEHLQLGEHGFCLVTLLSAVGHIQHGLGLGEARVPNPPPSPAAGGRAGVTPERGSHAGASTKVPPPPRGPRPGTSRPSGAGGAKGMAHGAT